MDWGEFLTAVSFALAVIGIALAGWSIRMGLRGEAIMQSTQQAADKAVETAEDLVERVERIREVDRTLRAAELLDIVRVIWTLTIPTTIQLTTDKAGELMLRLHGALLRRGDVDVPLADQLHDELMAAYVESAENDGALTSEAMARLTKLAAEAQGEVSKLIPEGVDPARIRPGRE